MGEQAFYFKWIQDQPKNTYQVYIWQVYGNVYIDMYYYSVTKTAELIFLNFPITKVCDV